MTRYKFLFYILTIWPLLSFGNDELPSIGPNNSSDLDISALKELVITTSTDNYDLYENNCINLYATAFYQEGASKDITSLANWSVDSSSATVSSGKVCANAVSQDISFSITVSYTENNDILTKKVNMLIQNIDVQGSVKLTDFRLKPNSDRNGTANNIFEAGELADFIIELSKTNNFDTSSLSIAVTLNLQVQQPYQGMLYVWQDPPKCTVYIKSSQLIGSCSLAIDSDYRIAEGNYSVSIQGTDTSSGQILFNHLASIYVKNDRSPSFLLSLKKIIPEQVSSADSQDIGFVITSNGVTSTVSPTLESYFKNLQTGSVTTVYQKELVGLGALGSSETSEIFSISYPQVAGDYKFWGAVKLNDPILGINYIEKTTPIKFTVLGNPANPPISNMTAHFTNISTRSHTSTGLSSVIGGFTIQGTGTCDVMIRGFGKGIGLSPNLDTQLLLQTFPEAVELMQNSSWQTGNPVAAIPTHLHLPDPTDAGIFYTRLSAGAYTVTMTPEGVTGIGLIGVDEVSCDVG